VARIERLLHEQGVEQAVLAGGFSRMRAVKEMRPDLGLFRIVARLRSFRDDALLRAAADEFESAGIRIVAPTELLREILAPEGHLAGPRSTLGRSGTWRWARWWRRSRPGRRRADGGGEERARPGARGRGGTDACIRRGAELGGPGIVVVKRSKPGRTSASACRRSDRRRWRFCGQSGPGSWRSRQGRRCCWRATGSSRWRTRAASRWWPAPGHRRCGDEQLARAHGAEGRFHRAFVRLTREGAAPPVRARPRR
jgi:hypothetical protein